MKGRSARNDFKTRAPQCAGEMGRMTEIVQYGPAKALFCGRRSHACGFRFIPIGNHSWAQRAQPMVPVPVLWPEEFVPRLAARDQSLHEVPLPAESRRSLRH